MTPSQPNTPSAPRRSPVLLVLALLVALLIGSGLGAFITNALVNHSSSGNNSNITLGSSSAPNVSVSSTVTDLQANLERVAATVEPSVVKITSNGSQGEAIGSGDILTSDGYIVTNDHVVNGFTSFSVAVPNGGTYTAQLIGQDAQDDLAVIKINAHGLKPISIADSSKATTGEYSMAIGYPLGLSESVTYGIVSGLNRAVSEAPDGPAGELVSMIQTSAQLNPGNSGGALVNLDGQLIGIPTLEATNSETNSAANGVGYAISSNRMEYVVRQLIASGKLTNSGQGFLGIETQDLRGQNGIGVAGFTNDANGKSPAQSAGLQAGDIITAVNGQAISTSDDLAGIVLADAPGAKISVTVDRNGSSVIVSVTLGERPATTSTLGLPLIQSFQRLARKEARDLLESTVRIRLP
jgi:S1-C subfamily serine protease